MSVEFHILSNCVCIRWIHLVKDGERSSDMSVWSWWSLVKGKDMRPTLHSNPRWKHIDVYMIRLKLSSSSLCYDRLTGQPCSVSIEPNRTTGAVHCWNVTTSHVQQRLSCRCVWAETAVWSDFVEHNQPRLTVPLFMDHHPPPILTPTLHFSAHHWIPIAAESTPVHHVPHLRLFGFMQMCQQ